MSFRHPPPLAFSLAALIAANLLPLAGVLFFGWRVFDVMLLFWAENVIIGLLNIARMFTVLVARGEAIAVFLICFFAIHYGGFAAGHGLFVFSLFGPGPDAIPAGLGEAAEMVTVYLIPLIALLASHLFSFVVNFLLGGEFRRVSAEDLMMAPYPRVFVLHVAIILGGLAVQASGQPVAALVLLIALKIGIDAKAHISEHQRLARKPVRTHP